VRPWVRERSLSTLSGAADRSRPAAPDGAAPAARFEFSRFQGNVAQCPHALRDPTRVTRTWSHANKVAYRVCGDRIEAGDGALYEPQKRVGIALGRFSFQPLHTLAEGNHFYPATLS
jgi:hypothetical protein